MASTGFVIFFLFFGFIDNAICDESNKNNAEIYTMGHAPTTLLHVDSTSRAQDLAKLSKLNVYRRLTGSSHSEIAAKINKHVASHSSVKSVVPCSDLDASSVVALASKLLPYVDKSMGSSLPEDDGRQVYLNLDRVDEHQVESSAYRNALCAEVVKLWAHHISRSVKDTPQVPVLQYVIPSLPVLAPGFNRTDLIEEQFYAGKSITCIAGHSAAQMDGSDTQYMPDVPDRGPDFDPAFGPAGFGSGEPEVAPDWPNWPNTFHWKGTGYGPYPFWQFGFSDKGWDDGWVVNESFADGVYDGADLEVWHSTALQATKFYHNLCRWEWIGFKELGHDPCVALHLNTYGETGKWYLFSADSKNRSADDRFCCDASFTGHQGAFGLGTINRKFMENMKYFGEEDFRGRYYTGRAKLYILSMIFRNSTDICPWCEEMPQLPIDVWYETTLEGKPLRIGELGQDIAVDGYLHDTDLPLIYEEMDLNTLESPDAFDDSVFQIPNVCSTNLHSCAPGRDNRENWGQDLQQSSH